MQRCGQCGFELTDAAIKMGYCPNCGSLLRVEGAPPPEARVIETPYAANPAAPPVLVLRPPAHSLEDQPVPPPMLPVASPAVAPPSQGVPEAVVARGAAPPPTAQPGPATPAMPTTVVVQRRGGAGAGIAIALLIIVLAAGGVLYGFGSNGVGPLARLLRGSTTTTSAVAPTAVPSATATVLPTATTVPPTPTPLPTVPPAPQGFKAFTAADGSYGLNVPANWTQSPVAASGITGTDFRSALTSQDFVQIDQGAVTSFVPERIVDYVRNFATSSNGTAITVTQNTGGTTLGRNTWTSAVGTYTVSGAQHKVVGLAITHGQSTYLVFYDALASAFADDPGTTYDTMVKSFTFLS